MQSLNLINWPHADEIMIQDSPDGHVDGHNIYGVDEITAIIGDVIEGTYHYISLKDANCHIFDVQQRRAVYTLGPYTLHPASAFYMG